MQTIKKIFIFLVLCISNCAVAMEEENPLQEINQKLRMMALQKSELEPEFAWLFPKVEALIRNRDINATDDLGNTRLHYAAFLMLFPAIKRLLILGADPTIQNTKGQDPFTIINDIMKLEKNDSLRKEYKRQYEKIFYALLKHRPHIRFKNNATLLHMAIQMQQVDLVEKTLAQGIDQNQPGDFGNTPLNYAINYVDSTEGRAIINTLLKAGAQPDSANSEGQTPLHGLLQKYFAKKSKNPPAVNLELINLMEQLFARSQNKNPQDKQGNTPLYILAAGLKNTIANDKMHILIKMMLQQGADPNIQNKEGFTPLHAAVLQHNAELVKLLIDHGANPFIRTFQPRTHKQIKEKIPPMPGKTPLEIAIELRSIPGIPLEPLLKIETMLKKAQRIPPAIQPKIEVAKPAAAALIQELEHLTKKLEEVRNID